MSGTVVVVGSLNVDLVVGLERMPAEGETVFGQTFERHAGGKGLNQAIGAARQGAHVLMIGAVGDDDGGVWLREIVGAEGIDEAGVASVPGPSGTAVIEVDAAGRNRIIVIPGANELITAKSVTDHIRGIPEVDVILTNGEVPLDVSIAALTAGRSIGALTILNPAPSRDYSRHLAFTDVLIPNEHEAADISGLVCESDESARFVATELQRRGVTHVIITRGDSGSLWAGPDGIHHINSIPVTAIDSVAAGDAYCGALAAGLADGLSFADALRRATAAGALSVTVRGAVPSLPTSLAVDSLLARYQDR